MREMENWNKRVAELIYEMGLLTTLATQGSLRVFYDNDRVNNSLSGSVADKSNMFESKCICISRKDLIMLKKGLFRITRGNSWVYEA
jgi:hypothetical protein